MVNPAQHYLCRSLLFNGYSDFLWYFTDKTNCHNITEIINRVKQI
jgi:hypothetical protein